jgi:hypothetical protein
MVEGEGEGEEHKDKQVAKKKEGEGTVHHVLLIFFAGDGNTSYASRISRPLSLSLPLYCFLFLSFNLLISQSLSFSHLFICCCVWCDVRARVCM